MAKKEKGSKKFCPWEDEEGKKKPKRGDSIPPKTNIQSRVHSKPKTDGQEYLDMYIRTKEKERSEKYGAILAKRLKAVSDSWLETKKDLKQKTKEIVEVSEDVLEESEEPTDSEVEHKKKPPGHLKTMDWSY